MKWFMKLMPRAIRRRIAFRMLAKGLAGILNTPGEKWFSLRDR
jgi:hypothetical protein